MADAENQADIDARIAELKEEINLVSQAIQDILKSGQSYGLADRRFQGAQLSDLRKHRRELRATLSIMLGQVASYAHGDVNIC